MKIGIIVAMEKELKQLKTIINDTRIEEKNGFVYTIGNIKKHSIIALQCGIGKVNAAMGAMSLIQNYAPQAVISTGVAGGADASLNVKDVVVSVNCAYHDLYCGTNHAFGEIPNFPVLYPSDKQLVDKVDEIVSNLSIKKGLIVTGDWFVDSVEKMKSILETHPSAMAVDMESCAISHVCYFQKVPFVSFRIISDVPLSENNAAQYHDFWDNLADNSFNVTRQFIEKL